MTEPVQTQGTEPGTGTPAPAQGRAATPPAYVTREEIDALKNELKASLTKNYQGVQSKTDSFQSRVQKQLGSIQETLGQLQKAGVQVTAEQANLLKQQALFDAFQQEPPAEAPGQGPAGAEASPELSPIQQQVTETAFEIMRTAGVEIEDNDPEVAIIEKANQGTPQQFYAAVREACKAKLARTSTPAPTPEQAAARMPGLSSGGTGAANPIGNITDPMTLIQMGLKK